MVKTILFFECKKCRLSVKMGWFRYMSSFRGFIAIDIEDVPKLVLELQRQIVETGADVKLVKPRSIHITLKFLGNVEEKLIKPIENIIRDAVVDVDPFTVKLRGAGVFPNQNYIRVIWIGIEDGDIIKIIAGRIDERLSELGFQREKREFSPHVTIARVKTAKKREDLMNVIRRYTDTSFKVFNVEAVALKKSVLTKEGAVYTTISKIKI